MKSYIDIKEFRELGYLQELNREYLHPLGLALTIGIDEEGDGRESIVGIQDYRNGEETGIYFDLANSSDERKTAFKKKAKYVLSEKQRIAKTRVEKLGFKIEPIITKSKNKEKGK